MGTLDAIEGQMDFPGAFDDGPGVWMGLRSCPNRQCNAALFTVWHQGQTGPTVLHSFPKERLPFDPAGIPTEIVESFDEALACYSTGAFRASAMMVRRTLELLCSSHGIAPNGVLAKRIAGLRERVILPAPLIDGLTELRWLGNDAAHVEARNFAEVGAEEVKLGIAVAREILKSLYQMDEFVAKLQDLRARNTVGDGRRGRVDPDE